MSDDLKDAVHAAISENSDKVMKVVPWRLFAGRTSPELLLDIVNRLILTLQLETTAEAFENGATIEAAEEYAERTLFDGLVDDSDEEKVLRIVESDDRISQESYDERPTDSPFSDNSEKEREIIQEFLEQYSLKIEQLETDDPEKAKRAKQYRAIVEYEMTHKEEEIKKYLLEKCIEEGRLKGKLTPAPKISPKKLVKMVVTTDKPSRAIFWKLEVMSNNPKAKKLSAERKSDRKDGKTGNLIVLLTTDQNNKGVKYDRRLTSYERRIVQALGSFYLVDQFIVTASQIYRAAFQDANPPTREIEKILKTIENLNAVKVTIDNREEVDKLEYKYDKMTVKGTIISTTICSATIGGVLVENAIRINALPPTYEFAMPRNQFTTVNTTIYKIPRLNQTEKNMSIIDYLIDRIVTMRYSDNINRTISITTLCDKCGITSKSTKSRLTKKLDDILNHFKKENFIRDFKFDGDKIIIETTAPTNTHKRITKK